MPWTKDDNMGPYSFGHCLCLCTAPSTSEPTPAWSLLYYKTVLKNPAAFRVGFLGGFFNCNAGFQREMKPDLKLNVCIATRGGPSSTRMLSGLLQPLFRPSTHLPGRCMAWRAAASCDPTPHWAQQYFEMSSSVAWIWGSGEGGLWRGGESQELLQRPVSLLMSHPFSLHGKARRHRDWPPRPALFACSSLCICQNKVNPLRE